MMIEAHQNQIEQLRESFKNRIAEADRWPQKASLQNQSSTKTTFSEAFYLPNDLFQH